MKLRNMCTGAILLCLAAAPPLTAGSDENKKQEDHQDAVAVVNGRTISRTTYERHLGNERTRRQQNGQEMDEAAEREMESAVLESLIDSELLYQAGADQGLKAQEEDIQQEYAAIRDNFQDEETFVQALEKSGFTEQSLKREIGRNLVIRQYVDAEIAPQVTVGPDEPRAYYDRNQEMFTQPEQVRASHIIIRLEDPGDQEARADALRRIKEIQARVEVGEDFGDLAREVSEGPSSQQGGDLGYFRRGQMVPGFENAAFGMEPGEVSGVVETSFGFHLIKVTDRRPEGKVPYEQVQEQIAEYLEQSGIMDEIDRTLQRLRDRADIRRLLASGEAG
jgi:peptidyl-prolyl cis-trans isomerase C